MSSLLFLYTSYSDWQSLSDLNAMSEKYSSGSATLITGDGGGGPVGTVNQILDVSMSAEGLFQVCILVTVLYACIHLNMCMCTLEYMFKLNSICVHMC